MLDVGKLPGEILLVRGEVEMPMPAHVEKYGLLLARLPRLHREVFDGLYGVCDFGGRNDPLDFGELESGLESGVLWIRPRLDVSFMHERREDGRVAVVPKPSCVDAGRDERMPEGVHFHERRRPGGVPEIIDELPFRQSRTRSRLGGDEPGVPVLLHLLAEERERDAAEVRASARAPDDDVRVFPGHLHLFDGFLPDDGLVEEDVVENRAERIFRVVVFHRVLDRLAYGDAE